MSGAAFGVVIPAHDEVQHIVATVETLVRQEAGAGRPFATEAVTLVVVENASGDDTAAVVEDFQATPAGRGVVLLRQEEASMVSSRILGMEHLLALPEPPECLVSADADTLFPSDWLAAVRRRLRETGADLVASAGTFERGLWERCPVLARRYADEVGTIFFDPVTIAALGLGGAPVPLSEQLFLDFGRPVSDAGFAILPTAYRRFGGFRRERYDNDKGEEILAVGWPLMFRCELGGGTVAYCRDSAYSTSARRLLREPDALFSGASYRDGAVHIAQTAEDEYARLDALAPSLDFATLRHYVLRDYVLQQCLVRPERVAANEHYFGELAGPLAAAIADWRTTHPAPGAAAVFAGARALDERFGAELLRRIAALGLRSPVPVGSVV